MADKEAIIAQVKEALTEASTLLLKAAAALEQFNTAQEINAIQIKEGERSAELQVANEVRKVETAAENSTPVQANRAGERQTRDAAELTGNAQAIKLEAASKVTRKNPGVVDLTGEEETTADFELVGDIPVPTTGDSTPGENDQNVKNVGQSQHTCQPDSSDEIEIVDFRNADQIEREAMVVHPTVEGPDAPEIQLAGEVRNKRKSRKASQIVKRIKLENAGEDQNAAQVTVNADNDDFDDDASSFSDDFVLTPPRSRTVSGRKVNEVASWSLPQQSFRTVNHKDCLFSNVKFEDCAMGHINLNVCDFENVTFQRCNFDGGVNAPTCLMHLNLINVVFKDCDFRNFMWNSDDRENILVLNESFKDKRWIDGLEPHEIVNWKYLDPQ